MRVLVGVKSGGWGEKKRVNASAMEEGKKFAKGVKRKRKKL